MTTPNTNSTPKNHQGHNPEYDEILAKLNYLSQQVYDLSTKLMQFIGQYGYGPYRNLMPTQSPYGPSVMPYDQCPRPPQMNPYQTLPPAINYCGNGYAFVQPPTTYSSKQSNNESGVKVAHNPDGTIRMVPIASAEPVSEDPFRIDDWRTPIPTGTNNAAYISTSVVSDKERLFLTKLMAVIGPAKYTRHPEVYISMAKHYVNSVDEKTWSDMRMFLSTLVTDPKNNLPPVVFTDIKEVLFDK